MEHKLEIIYKDINTLIPYINNTRTHSRVQIEQVKASIKEFGMCTPVGIHNDTLVYGHARVQSMKELGYKEVPTVDLSHLTEAQKKAYIIADNKIALNAGWDEDLLKLELIALDELGFDYSTLGFDFEFDIEEISEEEFGEPYADGVSGSMAENYGVAPFSIFDTRRKEWQERKKYWDLKIKDNGESREGTLGAVGGMLDRINSVSILDARMSEILVAWFGNKGGKVFDPFAGDSVFGFVSASLGMNFVGIELRKEQTELNQTRCENAGLSAAYINDSSENMDKHIEDESVDMVFSCPPYADLEVYSDDPRDLSNMSHDNFFLTYKKILQNTFKKLKQNRFAVIVIGEVRSKHGNYIGTVPNTIKIMEEAGYKYYNEIILINSAGTLPLRAGKAMKASRKVGKQHQNILVFLKGDAKKAVEDIGDIDMDFKYEEDGYEG